MNMRKTTTIFVNAFWMFAACSVALGAKAKPVETVKDAVVRFEDATGRPLEGAKVVVRMKGAEPSEFLTGDGGNIHLQRRENDSTPCRFDVDAPGCGRARGEVQSLEAFNNVTLALAKPGTPQYERALRGIVQDEDGRAVAGAMVRCSYVRTPGEGLISGNTFTVLTDDGGRFAMYVPEARRNGFSSAPFFRLEELPQHGDIIPPHSKYGITVETEGDDLFPRTLDPLNDSEAVIKLQRARQQFHLRFESPMPGGGFVPAEKFSSIDLEYAGPENTGRLRVDLASYPNGRKLIPGKYHATLGDARYEEIEITPQSVGELTFQLRRPVRFRGRVVDGITHQPLRGAIVVAANGTGMKNLAELTAEDWQAMRTLPAAPAANDAALKPLEQVFTVSGIVRTDANGWYEMLRPAGAETYALWIFDQDCVPIERHLWDIKPPRDGNVMINDIPLYPAAKVIVRPVCDQKEVQAWPRWRYETTGQPPWFEEFKKATDESRTRFYYAQWLRSDELKPMFVPAGVRVKIVIDADDEWSAAEPPQVVQLQRGETRDLGKTKLVHSVAVTVRVLDPSGRPIEGVAVRQHRESSDAWNVAHNTDAKGVAHFYVSPVGAGEFRITDLPGWGKTSGVKYTTGVKEGDVFTLKMTDSQLRDFAAGKRE